MLTIFEEEDNFTVFDFFVLRDGVGGIVVLSSWKRTERRDGESGKEDNEEEETVAILEETSLDSTDAIGDTDEDGSVRERVCFFINVVSLFSCSNE